jgi:hypothetical protein
MTLLLTAPTARAQYAVPAGKYAGTAGQSCADLAQNFAWPDANGNVLQCVSNVWVVVSQPMAAAGLNGYVQYNNGGALAGAGNLFWNSTSNLLGIGTASPANAIDVNGAAAMGSFAGTTAPSNGLIVSGQMGVGSSAPTAMLDINGSVSVGGKFGQAMTTFTSAVTATQTTLPVASTANFPSAGWLGSFTEFMTYTDKTATSFTGVTRGVCSAAGGHNSGSVVVGELFQIGTDICIKQATANTTFLSVFNNEGVLIGSLQYAFWQTIGSVTNPNAIASALCISSSNCNAGTNSLVAGVYSSSGHSTVGDGTNAFAAGTANSTMGDDAQTLGGDNNPTVATGAFAENIIGTYEKPTGVEIATSWSGADPVFAVGIGTSGQSANALMVFQDGQMLVNGGTTVAVPAGNASLTPMGTSTTSGAAALNAANKSGSALLYVRNDGNVGIGTTVPQATLDISGYTRLAFNASQPVACGTANKGAIALNHLARMCACNGSSWIFADSTGAACSW